jgi:hypothetical protein
MKSLKSWLGIWWIAWFGIVGGFFMVAFGEYSHQSSAARHFSLILMAVVGLSWIAFFVAESMANNKVDGERRKSIVYLLTFAGTLLAVFTLLGIGFVVFVAPRIP